MTLTVRHVLDVEQINRQLHGLNGGPMRDMLRRGLRVQTAARRNAPADRGRLRQSVEVGTVSTVVFGVSTYAVRVGTNLEYARAVHDGTGVYGPHGVPIRPTSGRYLVFRSKRAGRLVFVPEVKGQPGVPFLKDALRAARG